MFPVHECDKGDAVDVPTSHNGGRIQYDIL